MQLQNLSLLIDVPHRVFGRLALSPMAQGVQESAPSLLMEPSSHDSQIVLSADRYLPAEQGSEHETRQILIQCVFQITL